jgi:1,4-dihydroxy-6-naphthoate synthase
MTKLTLAFSPCPNDTFMMYALVHEKINTDGIQFQPVLLDIENLNISVQKNKFQVSKASAAIYNNVTHNYSLLNSGAAFGIEGGPMLISRPGVSLSEDSIIAIPGERTTAHALFNRYYKKPCQKHFVHFSDIFALLSSGRAEAGVIIHEDRFTFWQHGFECIKDLGLEWKNETSLPVPLGIFLAQKTLGDEMIRNIEHLISESIQYAIENYPEVLPWMQEHARNEHPDVIRKHIDFFVNVYSLNMGETGEKAIKVLFIKQ